MTCGCKNETGEPRPNMNTWGCGCNKMPAEPMRKGVVKFCDLCDPCNEAVSNVRLCAFVVPTLEEGRYYKNSFIFVQDEDAVYYISDDRSEIPFGSRPKFINDFDPNNPEIHYKDTVVYDVKNQAAYIYDDDGNRVSMVLTATPISEIVNGDGIALSVSGGVYTISVDNTIARESDLSDLIILVTNHTTRIGDLESAMTGVQADISDLSDEIDHVHDIADDADEVAAQARTEAQAAAQDAQTAISGLAGKQDSLTAGDNISIVNNVISATDTTYGAFTGTDGVDPGTPGLVPAPAASDAGKFLNADGTWDEVQIPVIPTFTGATAQDDGTSGLVVAPVAGDNTKYLKGDGTWDTPSVTTISNGDWSALWQ